jgi:hypothetical protein
MIATQLIAHANKACERLKTSRKTRKAWDATYQFFIDQVVSRLKARVRELREPESSARPSAEVRKLSVTKRGTAMPR